ncbi:unnamed protein product [Brachionus calyciflorus]|uniref:Fucosyltransferase n=1 Tax=Brachionus calyciflorus TaxID=104777 RepID=A0A814AN50_9BILA|nr:unnamed protein product [Brachionus calyciflorus]
MKLFTRRNKNSLVFSFAIIGFIYIILNSQLVPKSFLPNTNEESAVEAENKKLVKNLVENRPKTIENVNKNEEIKRIYAIDGSGMSSVNKEVIKCSKDVELEIIGSQQDYHKADFSYFLDGVPSRDSINAFNKNGNKSHYFMVFAMESEPHSGGGNSWINSDFKMWYNLDLSFPEPATYFDVKLFLPDLLSKPKVEFEQKEKSPLVWILSNCAAFNGREKFISKLMKKIDIDSYGFCLRNKETHTSVRMQGNIELYSKYKFVIAIENSNCEDYVTEKLVHAVASGSIPIVAGKNNKPNYLKFMPKHSYINVYDYKSIDDLVKHLKLIESDKNEYEKYIHFKKNHNYTREYLASLQLDELIKVAKTILGYEKEKEFFDGLITKEKSENKLCKIARYLKNTPKDVVEKEINEKRGNRPDTSVACLEHGNLGADLN